MTSLAARVLGSVKSRALVAPGDRVVAAVSGGADSVALLHLLIEIAPSLHASVAGVAHLNHRLRGTDGDGDEAFVGALAAELKLQYFTASEDVATLARRAGVSIEQAGHSARRAFYSSVLSASGGSRLATGHTADDQAETVLLRLIRGAGTRGLGGIHPAHGFVIRPLIDVTRSELRRYLDRRHVAWRHDASNDDPKIARNRVRLELLPLLRTRFSPAASRTLARAADLLRDDEAYLEDAATREAASVVLEDELGVSLDREALGALHPAIARRVVRHALRAVGRGGSIGARHVEQVLDAAQGSGREGPLVLPGAAVSIQDDRVAIRARQPARGQAPPRDVPPGVTLMELAVPGETDVPGLGIRVSAALLAPGAADAVAARVGPPDVVVLDAELAARKLFVRTRRPGDRLRPAGLGGRKKLQDLFVDRKVPRAERDRVPVVVDGRGDVVWVVGHAVSDAAVARGNASSVLLLRVKGPGG